MKLVAAAVALMMLTAVASGASAAAKQDATGDVAPVVDVRPQADKDGGQVAALNQRVAELETRLSESWWTEQDAIRVVREKLNEAATFCAKTGSGGSSTACLVYLSELMKGQPAGMPAFLAPTAARSYAAKSAWSGVYEPENLRWRVFSGGENSIAFYVYERTGLVEGAVRTAEQIHEDYLQELERRNDVRESLGLPPVKN